MRLTIRQQKAETTAFILPTSAQRFAKAFFTEFISGLEYESALHNYDLLVSAAESEKSERELDECWVNGGKASYPCIRVDGAESIFLTDVPKRFGGIMDYDLNNKVVMITGANSGIGKAACIQLAQCGATVVMACRSMERGALAHVDVRAQSDSPQVYLMQVDMSSQDSIRKFAQEFKERYQQLHVLIRNAANFDHSQKEPVQTSDRIETVFATNHLGPFLLTHLLLDQLKASAPSRIITVASKGLISYPFLDIEFNNLKGEGRFSLQHAYYRSKQAQVMFTFDLAERLRGTGVTVHCVRVANVAIPSKRLMTLPKWMRRMYEVKRKFSITPDKMAETYTWLAADPVAEQQTGGYWDAPGVPAKANKNAYNKDAQRHLWNISANFTGVKQP